MVGRIDDYSGTKRDMLFDSFLLARSTNRIVNNSDQTGGRSFRAFRRAILQPCAPNTFVDPPTSLFSRTPHAVRQKIKAIAGSDIPRIRGLKEPRD